MADIVQNIRDALRRDGPESASALARRLGVSTPTVTRALAKLGNAVVTIGKGRSSRHALRREVRDLGHAWPLYRINADGQSEMLGSIEALHGRYRWRLLPERPLPLFMHGEFAEGLYEDLPWFLQALRPQGYLGREQGRFFAAEIGAPDNILLWQADDILIGLLKFGLDLPGNLALLPGSPSLLGTFDAVNAAVRQSLPEQKLVSFEKHTEYADQTSAPKSSAGGEQQKFTWQILHNDDKVEPVIVKFASLVEANPTAQRWADLLICEEIALRLLKEHGIAAAPSEILDTDEWRFLQSTRFDRTPQGGRIGVFALDALDMAYIGSDQRSWLAGAEPLHTQGFIDRDDLERIHLLDAFGCLIGNNDMHFGNLSFFCEPDNPRIRLAPVYDMLPMHYRPAVSGLVREAPFELPNPNDSNLDASRRALWLQARSLAIEFWEIASRDERISAAFRSVCADNAVRINAWRADIKA